MSDLWDSLGADINKDATDSAWLYRAGPDVLGPMAQRAIVEKWLAGELTEQTPVARQGTDFAPLCQVAAFAPFREQARAAQLRRRRRTATITLCIGAGLLLSTAAAAAYVVRNQYRYAVAQEHAAQVREQQDAQARALAQAQIQAEAERQALVAKAAAHSMKLVALVSLGSVADVQIAPAPKKPKRRALHRRGLRRAIDAADTTAGGTGEDSAGPPDDSLVETCQLGQADIFSTLRQELAKLNVCVEDEKRRDDADLLPKSLELQFVIKNDGKVIEFAVNDRHFRTGALNNCFVKAFKTIRFKQTQGAACPVTIPIKIGS